MSLEKSFGEKFGELLKEKRLEAGLKQSELSFRSLVPLDSIRSIECGRIKSPGLLISFMLTKALNEKLDVWLAKIETELNEPKPKTKKKNGQVS